ncbi:MAG: tetracycline resistance MFS efflux pump [Anaerolineales bacterium]
MTADSNAEKLDFKRILPILVIVLVDLLGLSIIIPLLPLYAARFGASPFTIGLLGATYPLMQFLGAPILGRLSDKFGRKPVLVVSQIGTLLGFILLGFANTLWLLFISRIIDGISGANISAAQAAISDSTTEKTRTQGLGLVGAAFGLGFILGPIIAFTVLAASGGNYQLVAFAAAFFSLLSILLTIFWFKETLTDTSQSARKSPFTFAAMKQALSRETIGFLLVLMFFYQLAFGGYENMFSLFTLSRLGMDATSTTGLFVFAGLLIVAVQGGFVGRWSKKFGDRWLVSLGLSTLALGLILTSVTPRVPVPWYDKAEVKAGLVGEGSGESRNIRVELPETEDRGWLGIVWMIIATIPAAVGGGVLYPTINSLISKSVDPSEVGGMLGISSSFYSAANAVAPLAYGALFEWFGSTTPFLIGGLLLAALWLLAPRLIQKQM